MKIDVTRVVTAYDGLGVFARQHPTVARTLRWVLAALLVLAVMWYCWPHARPLPPAEAKTVDSLGATALSYHRLVDTLHERETTYVRQAATAERAAVVPRHVADSLAALADSLARIAAHYDIDRDSADTADAIARAWRTVAELRAVALDSMRRSADSLRAGLQALSAGLVRADARAAAAEARVRALDDLTARLVHDVQHAGECRVAGLLACPSRRVSAIGGGLLGAALTAYALH